MLSTLFLIMNFATTPTVPSSTGGGGDTGGGGAPTGGTPPAGGGSSPSAPPATPGQPGGQPGQQPGQQGIDNIRTEYERLKKEYEPWKALGGKPDEIRQQTQAYQAAVSEVSRVGKEIGYTDEEIAEAVQGAGLLPTLDFLRREAEEGNTGGQGEGEDDISARIKAEIEKGFQPYKAQENVRRTEAANHRFEQTTRGLIADYLKGKGVPADGVAPEITQFLVDATSEVFKYDKEGVTSLKSQGKTAGIQRAFNDIMDRLDRYYVWRSGAENKGRPAPGGKSGAPTGGNNGGFDPKRSKLDQMIEDPSLINTKYKS